MSGSLPSPMPGWRSPGTKVRWRTATTANLASLWPWHAGADLGPRGTYLGRRGGSGAAFFFDPFELYTRKVISNPNILVLGDVGKGKSTTVKSLVRRSVGVLRSANGEPRWVAILDPKREYESLAADLHLQVVRLAPGGGVRVNPLDAGPAGGRLGADALLARRTDLVATLLGTILGRDLTPLEEATCAWTVDDLTAGPVEDPTLLDLHRRLADPSDRTAERAGIRVVDLAERTAELRYAVERMLGRDLRGMFDGCSTIASDLGGRGLVIDLSAVFGNPRLLTPVMVCVTGWLQTLLARTADEGSGPQRFQVIDEAWALLANERTARYLQSCWRLSRAWGLCNIAVTHTVEDLLSQADDGTAVVKVARGLVQTTDTIVHHYAKRCGDEARSLLGLTGPEAAAIPQLGQGWALWRIAGRASVVQHVISETERALFDTDKAMIV